MARSAKQRAATKRLVAFNRSRKRSKVKRRRSTRRRKTATRRRRAAPRRRRATKTRRKAPARRRKSNKRKSPSKSMAFNISKIPVLSNPSIRKAATGIGIATIGVTLLALVAPQIAANPIVRPALAFLGGGIPGVIASIFLGGGQALSGIFGGNGGGGAGGSAAA